MSSTKTPSAGDISTVAADYGLNPKYPRLISKPELQIQVFSEARQFGRWRLARSSLRCRWSDCSM